MQVKKDSDILEPHIFEMFLRREIEHYHPEEIPSGQFYYVLRCYGDLSSGLKDKIAKNLAAKINVSDREIKQYIVRLIEKTPYPDREYLEKMATPVLHPDPKNDNHSDNLSCTAIDEPAETETSGYNYPSDMGL